MIALKTEQLAVWPFGIVVIQCAHPKPTLTVSGRVVETNACPPGKWITKRLEQIAPGVPVCNSLSGGRDKSPGLSYAERHHRHSGFKYVEAPRLGREPEDLVLLDDVHPVKKSFLRVPDRTLSDHIADFENVLNFGHNMKPSSLSPDFSERSMWTSAS